MKREKYENIWETALGVESKTSGYEGKKSVCFNASHGGFGDEDEVIDSEEKFGLWMGGPFSKNREEVRELFSEKAKTILDVACGAGPEYFGLQESRPDLKYTGLDITPRLVSYCQSKGINAVLGTANDMVFGDSSFDIVHSRHSLEHMKDFRDALSEFVRVARKNIFVSFFIKPLEGSKKISDVRPDQDLEFYNNQYDKLEIEDFLKSMTKVITYQWIDIHEGILLKIEVNEPDWKLLLMRVLNCFGHMEDNWYEEYWHKYGITKEDGRAVVREYEKYKQENVK